jgi:Protein of unknown function (DUF1573)
MIKKITLLALVICFLTSCSNKDKKATAQHDALVKKAMVDSSNFTSVKWLDTLFNFGTIKQGEKITLKFRCLNTGSKPLVLTNVRPGCGCTIAEYSKEAILPNKEGWVTASFNSKKFCGEVHKSVLATTNTNNDSERNLQFTGTIINCENDKVVQPHPMPNEN